MLFAVAVNCIVQHPGLFGIPPAEECVWCVVEVTHTPKIDSQLVETFQNSKYLIVFSVSH